MFTCITLFLIGTFGLLSSFAWINRRESGGRIIFTPLLLFCLNELVFVWPATVYARVEGISQDNYASLVVLTSAFAYLAGYVMLLKWNSWSSRGPAFFWSQPLCRPNEKAHLLVFTLGAVLCVLLGLYFYQGLPPIVTGMQEFLHNGYDTGVNETIAQRRLELTKGHFFGGEYRGQGAIRVLLRTGLPYLTIVALVIYLFRKNMFWRFVSLGSLLACFVYIGGDGTRGPFLWSLVTILVAISYYARFQLRTLIWFGSILLLGLIVLSLPQKLSKVAAMGGNWKDAVGQISERLFFGNGVNSIHVVEYIRNGYLDLHWGSIHYNDTVAALPFVESDIPFSYELFLLKNPNAKARRTTLSSMTYLGSLYGDFGWAGAMIGYFIFGGITASFSRVLFRKKKTAANVALVGMTVMTLGQLNLNGMVYCMVSLSVLMIVSKTHEFFFSLASLKHPKKGYSLRSDGMTMARNWR